MRSEIEQSMIGDCRKPVLITIGESVCLGGGDGGGGGGSRGGCGCYCRSLCLKKGRYCNKSCGPRGLYTICLGENRD